MRKKEIAVCNIDSHLISTKQFENPCRIQIHFKIKNESKRGAFVYRNGLNYRNGLIYVTLLVIVLHFICTEWSTEAKESRTYE